METPDSVVVSNSSLEVNSSEISARYQLICLRFDTVGWLRRSPQHSDEEVLCEANYDWSNMIHWEHGVESVQTYLERFQRAWFDSKICPNPNVYIVENSDWDVGPSKEIHDLKHFLIVGESSFIEILAKECTWTSEGNLSW